MIILPELDFALHWLRLAIDVAGLLDRTGGTGKNVTINSAIRIDLRTTTAAASDQRNSDESD